MSAQDRYKAILRKALEDRGAALHDQIMRDGSEAIAKGMMRVTRRKMLGSAMEVPEPPLTIIKWMPRQWRVVPE